MCKRRFVPYFEKTNPTLLAIFRIMSSMLYNIYSYQTSIYIWKYLSGVNVLYSYNHCSNFILRIKILFSKYFKKISFNLILHFLTSNSLKGFLAKIKRKMILWRLENFLFCNSFVFILPWCSPQMSGIRHLNPCRLWYLRGFLTQWPLSWWFT